MKKNVLFLAAMLFASMSSFAQISFSDDFESYNVGDYVGSVSTDWTTWSGATGGAEDAQVTDAEAASGTNSIYFAGQGAGGPQDVVLPFGGKHTTGQFDYSMNVLVPESSTGGYFNFQAEVAIGTTWAMDVFFRDNGLVEVTTGSGGAVVIQGIYPKGEWFTISCDINLTANVWAVGLNGQCLGDFENPNNSLASIDIFPTAGGVNFYVDDVTFDYNPMADPVVAPTLDLGLGVFNLRAGTLTGANKEISSSVTNNGTEMVTSFDLTFSDGNSDVTKSFDGLTLAMGDTYAFSLDNPYTVLEGTTGLSMTISNVNGTNNDENDCNNATAIVLTGYTPAPGKGVYVEEATGTWCQFCPRGAVWMEILTEDYPDHFMGVAVHNNDPMVVPEHDAVFGTFTEFTGYPSSIVARETVIDPSAMEAPFLQNLTIAPVALLENGATYDAATGDMQMSLAATFSEGVSGDNRLNIVVIEDGVTGTLGSYAQSNAFSGGTTGGVLAEYENLPNPVPASIMVYDHVSRAIMGGFAGEPGTLPSTVLAGETHVINYTINIPAEWDVDKIKIIGFMLNADGTAENATETTIPEAVANGFQAVVSTENLIATSAVKAFPNPMGEELNISLSLQETAEVTANLYSVTGTLLRSQVYGQMNGDNTVSMATDDLPSGIYQLNVVVGKQVIVKKVVK